MQDTQISRKKFKQNEKLLKILDTDKAGQTFL